MQRPSGIEIKKAVRGFSPPKIVYYTVEGFGKTTFAAYAPSPLFLMAQQEDGYNTLLDAGRVPAANCATVSSWHQLNAALDLVLEMDDPGKTLVLESATWFEYMCFDYVCTNTFDGKWDRFFDFRKGPERAMPVWISMLRKLDAIRDKKKMMIVFISHAKSKKFRNPQGADYDVYTSDTDENNIWAPTKRWADVVMFGNFLSVVSEDRDTKGKGIGGDKRVVYTQHQDAFDAKNRYGMQPIIELPDVPEDGDMSLVFKTIWREIVKSAAPTQKGNE